LRDEVVWECVLPGGVPHTLRWPRVDFGPSMGIQANIPASLVEDFLPKIIGREMKLVIDLPPLSDEDMSMENIIGEADRFADGLYEGNNEKNKLKRKNM
jgi:hypothetical protein